MRNSIFAGCLALVGVAMALLELQRDVLPATAWFASDLNPPNVTQKMHQPATKVSNENGTALDSSEGSNAIRKSPLPLAVPAAEKAAEEGQRLPVTATTPPPPLYRDLSCPLEWSKYSCFHHGKREQAEAAYQLALEPWKDYVSEASGSNITNFLFSPRKLILVGDSTMRQIFVAMACHFSSMAEDLLEDYHVDWRHKWPCHETPNCVKGGQHSGFNVGKLKLKGGLEIYFVPIGGSLEKTQGKLIAKWLEQWNKEQRLSFQLEPTSANVALNRQDIIVYNIGLHDAKRGNTHEVLQGLGKSIIAGNSSRTAPSLVYMTTITQHFPTNDGRYMGKKTPLGCIGAVQVNPRRQEEEEKLMQGLHVDYFFNPQDEALGDFHIGGNDCTHYCMPGVPDLEAMSMIRQFANEPLFHNH